MGNHETVSYVNSIGAKMGFQRMPSVSQKIAQTLGLRGVPGVNVSSGGDYGGGSGGGGYGDRRSYGADDDGG